MRFSSTVAAGAFASLVSAEAYLGFNSGATKADNSAKLKSDYQAEFKTAQNLKGAPGKFNSIRLYTNIQADSKDDPSQAFEAAMDTKTNILLGVWASGVTNIDLEISALKTAVSKWGKEFTDLVIGISIGSEDLYRDSKTGRINKSGIGNSPQALVKFIGDFKKAFANTALSKIPVGHVDTWDVWGNSTNQELIQAVDWVGVDEYPYYQNATGNDITNSGALFDKAYGTVKSEVGGKPVWVTETGWPYSGPAWDEAKPSVKNAKYYWDEVGCRVLFNKVPTFWYNLEDSNPDNSMKFAITDNLSTTPRFDLKCPTHFETPKKDTSSASTTSSSASTKTSASASGTASASPSSSSSSSSSGDTTSAGSSGSGSSSSSSGNDSGTSTGSGSSAASSSPSSSNASHGAFSPVSAAMYAGLALAAGVFTLL